MVPIPCKALLPGSRYHPMIRTAQCCARNVLAPCQRLRVMHRYRDARDDDARQNVCRCNGSMISNVRCKNPTRGNILQIPMNHAHRVRTQGNSYGWAISPAIPDFKAALKTFHCFIVFALCVIHFPMIVSDAIHSLCRHGAPRAHVPSGHIRRSERIYLERNR